MVIGWVLSRKGLTSLASLVIFHILFLISNGHFLPTGTNDGMDAHSSRWGDRPLATGYTASACLLVAGRRALAAAPEGPIQRRLRVLCRALKRPMAWFNRATPPQPGGTSPPSPTPWPCAGSATAVVTLE